MNVSSIIRSIKYASGVQSAALKSAKITGPLLRKAHRYGPEVLTGLGIAGGLGTAILASRATLKLEATLDTTNEQLKIVENSKDLTTYNQEHYQKEIFRIRVSGAKQVAKLYLPAITLGAFSAAAVLSAHGIMRKRNAALVAAYKALETSYDQYRKHVKEQYGEEIEKDIRQGINSKRVTDKETGEKKTEYSLDPNRHSPYARFFDESCPDYDRTPEYNLLFLKCRQQYCNDKLHAQGYLFLNEVYEQIGLPKTKAGQVVGWVISPDSDNYIDFGIYDFSSPKARQFVNGYEKSILLDFNVDGTIIDKVGF